MRFQPQQLLLQALRLLVGIAPGLFQLRQGDLLLALLLLQFQFLLLQVFQLPLQFFQLCRIHLAEAGLLLLQTLATLFQLLLQA